MNKTNPIVRLLSFVCLLGGLVIGQTYAASDSCIVSGTNYSGSLQATCTIVTTATTNLTWNAYITGWSGGGGITVTRSGTTVLSDWVTVNVPKSVSRSGQAAGTYQINHGFNGPPGAVSGTLNCTLTW